MSLSVTLFPRGANPRRVPGPGDLYVAGPADVILVRGKPGARDHAHWGAAIGSAVLRGASVQRG